MKIKMAIIAAVVVIAGGAIYAIQSWAGQPSTGISSQDQPTGTEVQGDSIALTDFLTTYFSSKLTSDLKVISQSESPSAAIKGQYLIVNKNPKFSTQLAITIGGTSGSTIEDVSPVKFRTISPKLYQRTISDAGYPEGSVVFTKKEGYEKSVFWLHGGNYAAVVVSGGIDQRTELENTIRIVMQNWQWL